MKKIITILLILSSLNLMSQSFIEMMSPEDADVVLLAVGDIEEADIVVYITKDKKESQNWDCMWRQKKWGFANFSVFIAWDTTQLEMKADQSLIGQDYTVPYQGKVYITANSDQRGYRNKNFKLEGVMKVTRKKKFYIDM